MVSRDRFWPKLPPGENGFTRLENGFVGTDRTKHFTGLSPRTQTSGLEKGQTGAHILRMTTIVKCDCGAEYERTDDKFLVPHTGHASCKVCGATLESWVGTGHVPTFELVKRPGGTRGSLD